MKRLTSNPFIRKYLHIASKANTFNLFGPKSWVPQTDYNPVPPGSDRPKPIDMRPKAVEERERQARNSLIAPLAIIIGVVLVLGAAVLIKVVF